jgi:hypothetical protein
MISPDVFKQILVDGALEVPQLKKAITVVNEDHFRAATKELTKEDYPLVVGMVPSATRIGQRDGKIWRNVWMIYVLHASDYGSLNLTDHDTQSLLSWEAAQEFVGYLDGLSETDCHVLARYNGNVDIDPEYNWNEHDGWSLVIHLESI